DPTTFVQPIDEVTSIACISSTDCYAGAEDGTVVPFDGTSWHEPVRVDPSGMDSIVVSCASSGLCAAVGTHGVLSGEVGDGSAAVLLDHSWSATSDVLPNAIAVSCGGSRCVAVSKTQYSTYNAADSVPGWSAAADLPRSAPSPGGDAVSVACISATD